MIIIALFLIFVLGYSVVAVLCPISKTKERLVLAFPIGIGLGTLIIWALLATGSTVSISSIIFVQGTMSAVFGASLLTKPKRFFNPATIRNSILQFSGPIFFLIILLSSALWLNLVFPVMVSDGIGYQLFGVLAIAEQNLMIYKDILDISDQNRTLGFHFISSLTSLFGFTHPKLFQLIFYFCLVQFFHISLRRFTDSRRTWHFTLLLASAPMVWWHSFLYLNNLAAGFYFFCGVLYWFLALDSKEPRYIALASLGFMLACWIRYELILLFCITLALTMFWDVFHKRILFTICLLFFPLVFSGVWAAYSLHFYPGTSRTFQYMIIFLGLLSSGIFFGFFRICKVSLNQLIFFFALFSIIALIAVSQTGPWQNNTERLVNVISAKFFNNLMVQSVWGFGILLTLFIPRFYSDLYSHQKLLLWNLIGIFLGFTFIFSLLAMDHPMLNEPIWERIKFFIEHPGRIATRTSSREFFILFPGVLFFLGMALSQKRLPSSKLLWKSILFSHKPINGINLMVCGNLIIILIFFIIPRIKFLKTFAGSSDYEILESIGPTDNPNIYQPTYIISHAVAKLTPKNSTLIFPHPYGALTFKKKPYDSLGIFATHEVLYPRRIYWKRLSKSFPENLGDKNLFLITYDNPLGNNCKNHPQAKSLNYHSWTICPINNG